MKLVPPNITPSLSLCPDVPSHVRDAKGRLVAGVMPDIGRDAETDAKAFAALPDVLQALASLTLLAKAQMDQSTTHDGLTNCNAITKAFTALESAGYTIEQ